MRGRALMAAIVSPLLISALVLAGIFIRRDIARQSAESVEVAAYRAALQCYALEGSYPPDLSTLERDYGLMVDHSRFIVYYDRYAANRPPHIKVLAR